MEEIKVGEYIRTKQGEIAKIVNTNMFDKSIYKDIQGAKYYLEDITKHGSNIIDLIEIGDYINGYKVINVFDNSILIDNFAMGKLIYSYEIKSIVTKEQFKIVSYEV